MKPLTLSKTLGVICVLFSGYSFAAVVHPENKNIVGGVFGDTVCFNSDGGVASVSECDGTDVDEGKVGIGGMWEWWGLAPSGINGCGLATVNPVSSATCPYTINKSFEEDCPFDKFVLVQTTGSGHYWAVKANGSCNGIATPESTGLVPCLATDAFDSVYGCYVPNPPEITVEGGFIKLDTSTAPPSGAHCDEIADEGRMVVDSVNGILYVCTAIGWEPIRTDEP